MKDPIKGDGTQASPISIDDSALPSDRTYVLQIPIPQVDGSTKTVPLKFSKVGRTCTFLEDIPSFTGGMFWTGNQTVWVSQTSKGLGANFKYNDITVQMPSQIKINSFPERYLTGSIDVDPANPSFSRVDNEAELTITKASTSSIKIAISAMRISYSTYAKWDGNNNSNINSKKYSATISSISRLKGETFTTLS